MFHSFWFWISAITALLYLFFKRRFAYWKNRGVPYLEPTIPLGSFSYKNFSLIELVKKAYHVLKDKGPFGGLYLFTLPAVVITDLDLLKNILIKDFNYFSDRGTFYNEKDDPLSAHLFNLDGEKWRTLRAKLSPTFTSGKMKFMFPTVVKVSEEFRFTLSEIITNKDNEIEMKELLARFTTDIIGTCAFGIDCNSLKDPNAEFRLYGRKVFDEPRSSRLTRQFKLQFRGLAKLLRMKNTRDDVHKFFMNVVRETVEYREKNKVKRNDFMDLLIELKNNEKNEFGRLSVEEIAAQAFVFFLAGFETSSTTMSYSLYELALNQDIQNRARKEIEDVLEKHAGNLTYEAMMDMTYVDQIISESLRKYPPVTILTRRAVKNYSIPNSKHIIEKNTMVLVPAYEMHHDPNIFSDPENFNPDRFTPENIKNLHPVAFLGFGDGPRNCVGLRFGKMQSKVGLIMLLRNFQFSFGAKAQIPLKFSKSAFVLSPVGGLWLKVEKI